MAHSGPRRPSGRLRYPTVVDIAALAGVAPMTVSRVINQSGSVSPEVRKRVQRVIDKLEYHPNALARSLKSRRTRMVGILLPDIQNPFAGQLAGSIQQVLQEHGYSAFICTTEQSMEREQAALGAFFDHRVEGIVVATMETPAGSEALARFMRRGMPIVVVGREPGQLPTDRVTADHRQGGRDAVEHLVSLGHTRIGYVGVSPSNGPRLRRFQGFADALRDHSLPLPDHFVAGPEIDIGPGYSTQADGYHGMKRLLALPDRPTAVCVRNDYTAMGAILAARQLGFSIPDDIAIVGFDNVPLSEFTAPPLTTVDQPTVEEGRRVALLLLERIEGPSGREPTEVCLECRLIVRESTVRRPRAGLAV
jgi:DNA-binding LacI/PurR family transcriptional regulator